MTTPATPQAAPAGGQTFDQMVEAAKAELMPANPAENKTGSVQQAEPPASPGGSAQEPPAPEKKAGELAEPPSKPAEPPQEPPKPDEKGEEIRKAQTEIEGLKKTIVSLRKDKRELKQEKERITQLKSIVIPDDSARELPAEYQQLYQRWLDVSPEQAELKKEEWLVQINNAKRSETANRKADIDGQVRNAETSLNERINKMYVEVNKKFPELSDPKSEIYSESVRIAQENSIPDNDFFGQVECVLTAGEIIRARKESRIIDTENVRAIERMKIIADTIPPALPASGAIDPPKKESWDGMMKEAFKMVNP